MRLTKLSVLDLADLTAEASDLAYSARDAISTAYRGRGFAGDPVAFAGGETQGFFLRADDACILAFRGTEPERIEDWLTDARIITEAAAWGRVHGGFASALRDVWGPVAEQVRAVGARPVVVTGHSLGGALAVMAAARIRTELGHGVHAVHTYGQPRVGNGDFCRGYERELGPVTHRFVNGRDVVPHVPTRWLDDEYGHVGASHWFPPEGPMEEAVPDLRERLSRDVVSNLAAVAEAAKKWISGLTLARFLANPGSAFSDLPDAGQFGVLLATHGVQDHSCAPPKGYRGRISLARSLVSGPPAPTT